MLAGGASADAADQHGGTALMLAALKGHCECVEALLAAGATADAARQDGATALSLAVTYGDPGCIASLTEIPITCQRLDDASTGHCAIACTNVAGDEVARVDVPGGLAPYGEWLHKHVQMVLARPVFLVSTSGEHISRR